MDYASCEYARVPPEYLGKSLPPDEYRGIAPSQSLTLQSSVCLRPNPDSLWVVWKNYPQLTGKNTNYYGHLDPKSGVPIQYPYPSSATDDARIWTPNLNELTLERTRQGSASEWVPYKHMTARQGFSQFINAGILRRRDKWAKPVPMDVAVGLLDSPEIQKDNLVRQAIVARELAKQADENKRIDALYHQYSRFMQ